MSGLSRPEQLSYAIVVDTSNQPSLPLWLSYRLRLGEVIAGDRSKSMTKGRILRELNFLDRFFQIIPVFRWLLADLALLEELRLVLVLSWL